MSSFPVEPEPRSIDWRRLPLPVRSTRYLVATLLALTILVVVLITYNRIEQQLQATLEERLTAVLHEHKRATLHFIENTKSLTVKAASIIAHDSHLTVEKKEQEPHSLPALEPDSLRALLNPWVDLGVVYQMFVVDESHKQLIYGYPEGRRSQLSVLGDAKSPPPATARIEFGHLRSDGLIYAWSAIPGTDALIVAALRPKELIERINPVKQAISTHSYAYDRQGWLTDDGVPKASDGKQARFPATLLQRSQHTEVQAVHMGEYVGRQNRDVVGAWTWLTDYNIGIATEIPRDQARAGIERLRQSFFVLITLTGAAFMGFLALGRWTLRIRQESLLMTRRLSRLSRAIQPLSAALEHDPSAVLLVDQDGTVIYANAASHRVLKVHAPLIGQDADTVFEALPSELQTALASGQDSIVAQGEETDGETLLVSSHSLTIEGSQHFLYMLRPVTQQVRRQEVEHWKKLIRVLSHELNNALAPITSLLSSARKVNQMTHQDPRLGQIFESINERTAHLISFIEGYREVARLPRPAQKTIDWEVFLTSIESQKKFRRTGILPENPGFFDPIQLERVIVNLINNAHEANSPREDVEIEIIEDDERFRINVLDRGTGMPEAVLKQAMLPFFSTKRTGTGVGLALSREIIEAHGGQLALANREGGGLVVSCSLPKSAPPSRASLGKILLTPTSGTNSESEQPSAAPVISGHIPRF